MDWAIVQVNHGTEIDLSRKLILAGFDAYCPRLISRHRNRYSKNKYDRYRYSHAALFPGYFFLKINRKFKTLPLPIRVVNEIKLMSRASGLLTISQVECDGIRATEELNALKPLTIPQWKQNEIVRILGGAFEGTKGRITELRAKSALISFTTEGRSLEVFVRLSNLRKS